MTKYFVYPLNSFNNLKTKWKAEQDSLYIEYIYNDATFSVLQCFKFKYSQSQLLPSELPASKYRIHIVRFTRLKVKIFFTLQGINKNKNEVGATLGYLQTYNSETKFVS